VRVALGATTGRIVVGVLTEASRLVAGGLALGLMAGWWVSKSFASLLFEVKPTDWSTYVVVATGMAVVGLCAALVPARRAARIDPLVALREE
jgi:ABC-type antimicrobial peptide transport system permease subunit